MGIRRAEIGREEKKRDRAEGLFVWRKRMASTTSRMVFRIVMLTLLLLLLYYIGRPLYWKITATVHDIRNNKQTVRQGISQIVMEAQRSVGWYHDESDSGIRASNRKLLFHKSFSTLFH